MAVSRSSRLVAVVGLLLLLLATMLATRAAADAPGCDALLSGLATCASSQGAACCGTPQH